MAEIEGKEEAGKVAGLPWPTPDMPDDEYNAALIAIAQSMINDRAETILRQYRGLAPDDPNGTAIASRPLTQREAIAATRELEEYRAVIGKQIAPLLRQKTLFVIPALPTPESTP